MRSVITAAAGAALVSLALALAGSAPASADVVWLCKPGIAKDPCAIPQDTTAQSFTDPDRVFTPPTDGREIDCFYVYPTVSNQLTPNATKAHDPELDSIAEYQAARFSQHCRVFAPIYRQSTLASIVAGYVDASSADRQLGYRDVLEAWRDYLAHDNDGRGVVLIGHSQGSFVLRQLLRQEIEKHVEQRRLLVSAILLGGNVNVAAGKLVGGDFASTPLCTERAQVGCVVAYSTFSSDPPSNARFGKSAAPPADNPSGLPGGPGYQVACTDPRPLAGDTGPFELSIPTAPFAAGPLAAGVIVSSDGLPPTATTTWVIPADRYTGGCRTINGAHVLRYDPVGPSRRPLFFPEPTWGTHLLDMQLGLEPLVSFVGQEEDRWVHPDVRLARRCLSRGRLRVSLTGRDASFVDTAAIKLGRRTVARTLPGSLQRTLSARTLRSPRGKAALRVVAKLGQGQPRQLVLSRPRPRCGG